MNVLGLMEGTIKAERYKVYNANNHLKGETVPESKQALQLKVLACFYELEFHYQSLHTFANFWSRVRFVIVNL